MNRTASHLLGVVLLLWVAPNAGAAVRAPAPRSATLPWCAPATAPKEFLFEGVAYQDVWETDLPDGPTSVGAIWMKSGLEQNGRLQGHKIRDFAWAYQVLGQTTWHKIPQATLYANRAQLVLRFPPIPGVARMRLLVRPRSEEELQLTGANNPCLRQARFYPTQDAAIPVDPWFMSVASWEEGNPYEPMQHWGERFDPLLTVQQGLHELGQPYSADSVDEMWIGDFGPWVTHEPAPSGFLVSGNYKDYDTVDARVYDGFYRFIREREMVPSAVPMLGACGGHQLIAMAGVHSTFDQFKTEFAGTPDSTSQVVVTCSSVPEYACGNLTPEQCCYEGGSPDPFKDLMPNVTGLAMANPYSTTRWDMLLNLLPPQGATGMRSYLYHEDFVNPAKIAPWFDVIASYPGTVTGLSRSNPALVQGMKLRSGMVYGTQFHWDESLLGQCSRDPGNLNMERVLKNFVGLSLSHFRDPATYRLSSVSQPLGLAKLTDLDRASEWCGSDLTADFGRLHELSSILWVEGETPLRAAHQAYVIQASPDGSHWKDLAYQRQSAYELQKARLDGCPADRANLAGWNDGQTFLLSWGAKVQLRYLRIRLASDDQKPACLREILPF